MTIPMCRLCLDTIFFIAEVDQIMIIFTVILEPRADLMISEHRVETD